MDIFEDIDRLDFSDEELAAAREALEEDLGEPVFVDKEEIASGLRRTLKILEVLRRIDQGRIDPNHS